MHLLHRAFSSETKFKTNLKSRQRYLETDCEGTTMVCVMNIQCELKASCKICSVFLQVRIRSLLELLDGHEATAGPVYRDNNIQGIKLTVYIFWEVSGSI